jgi:RNA polymerase sigma factor (sigma-70 family)
LIRIRALPASDAEGDHEREAFFGLAAFMMRRLLAHHSRPLSSRARKVEVAEAAGLPASSEQSLREIEDTLSRLSAIDPTLRAVVEMRAFEGLSREEIAQRLGCSVRTVARHWEFAQHWLRQNYAPEQTAG